MHTQTAPTTFIAAALNATRRFFTGAANAIKGTFREDSAECMQLTLAHLQTVAKQTPQPQVASPPSIPTSAPSEATPTPEARAVLDNLRAAPVSARGTRILRIISSRYYADGCCYARQETLARAIGCAKSTLQSELDELEARKLLHVTPRDGTSNVTHLADGVREALRFQRIENRRRALARRGVAPLASKGTAASSPMPPRAKAAASPDSAAPSSVFRGTFKPKKRAKSEPKTGSKNGSALVVCSTIRPEATTWPERSTSRTKDCISDKSRRHVKTAILSRVREGEQAGEMREGKSEKIHVQGDENHVQSSENTNVNEIDNAAKPHKKPASTSLTTKHVSGENGNEKQGKDAARSRKAECTAPQNGKEGGKKAVAPSVLSHSERTTVAALLIAEGVTPKRAGEFAQLFDHDQIERTIVLGLHRTKKNPPGYLLTLIRDDPASRRIASGSEADRVRQHERSAALRGQIGPAKALEAREPVPGAVSPVQPKQRASEAICGTFSGESEPPPEVKDPLEALSPEDRDRYTQRAREEVLRANAWLGGGGHESNPIMQAMIRTQLRAMLATTEAPASRGAPSG